MDFTHCSTFPGQCSIVHVNGAEYSGLRSQALGPFTSCVALRKFFDFPVVQVPHMGL